MKKACSGGSVPADRAGERGLGRGSTNESEKASSVGARAGFCFTRLGSEVDVVKLELSP